MKPRCSRNRRFVASAPAVAALEALESRCLLTAAIPGITIDDQPVVVLPELPALNGQGLLAASDGMTTRLFTSDGSQAGTIEFAEIDAVITDPLDEYVINGNSLYFTAGSRQTGTELWKTDGTAAGTSLVADIHSGWAHDSNVFNGYLYADGDSFEIWINAADENFETTESRIINVSGLTGRTYATDLPEGNYTYWIRSTTNGVTSGWSPKQSQRVIPNSSAPAELTVLDGEVYFAATSEEFGRELWKTDGTPDGTVRLTDIDVSTRHSDPQGLQVFDGHLFFAAGRFSNGGLHRISSDDTEPTRVSPIPTELIGVVSDQLVLLGITDDHYNLATMADATSDPVIFHTVPRSTSVEYELVNLSRPFTAPTYLEEFTITADRLYFSRREYESTTYEHFPTVGESKTGRTVTARYLETSVRWETDLTTEGTVAVQDLDVPNVERSVIDDFSDSPSQARFAPALHVGDTVLYIDGQHRLNHVDGTPLAQLQENIAEPPTTIGSTAYALGRLLDGSQNNSLLVIDGDTGSVQSLGVSLRDADDISALTDEVFVRSTTDEGYTLLLIDQDAAAPTSPVVTAPASASSVPRGEVLVEWNAVSEAAYYDVIIRQDGTLLDPILALPSDTTSHTFEASAGEFEVFVRAGFADGTVSQSAVVAFTVLLKPGPALISPAVGTSPVEGRTELRWEALPVTSYAVRLYRQSDPQTLLMEAEQRLPFLHKDLPAGDYRIEVMATYPGGEPTETSSTEFTITPGVPAPAITSPTPAEMLPNETAFTWAPIAGVLHYEATIYQTVDGVETTVETVQTPADVTSHEFHVINGTYRVEIRGRFSNGQYSAAANHAFTVAPTAFPVLLEGEEMSHRNRLLRWTEVPNAENYQVWISDAGSTAFRFGTFGRPENTWRFGGGLTAGNFTVFLRALFADGSKSEWSPGYNIEVFATPVRIYDTTRIQNTLTPTIFWGDFATDAAYEIAIYEQGNSTAVYREAGLTGGSKVVPMELKAGQIYEVWMRYQLPNGGRSRWGETPVLMQLNYQPELSFTGNTLLYTESAAATETIVQLRRIEEDGRVVLMQGASIPQGIGQTFNMNPGNYFVEVASVGGYAAGVTGLSVNARLDFQITDAVARPVLTYTNHTFRWTALYNVRRYELIVDEIDDQGNIIEAGVVHLTDLEGGTDVLHQYEDPAVLELRLPEGRFRARIRGLRYETPVGDFSAPIIISDENVAESLPVVTSSFTETSDTRPVFAWSDTSGAAAFEVEIRNAANEVILTESNVTGTTFRPATPLMRGDLTFRIRGLHSDNLQTLFSEPFAFMIGHPEVSVTDGIDGGIDRTPELLWESVGTGVSYHVRIQREGEATDVYSASGLTTLSHEVTTALTDGTYLITVTAIHPDGVRSVTGTRYPVTIGSPRPVFGVVDNVASWLPIGGAQTYELWINSVNGNGEVVQSKAFYANDLNTLEADLSSLTNGAYEGWVRASRNEDGVTVQTQWSTRTRFVIGSNAFDPSVQPILTVSGSTASWVRVQSATRYELWVNEIDDQGNTLRIKALYATSLTDNTATLSSLSSGRYVAWVRAINSATSPPAASRWSARVEFVI